jgi:hypothetical protein
MPSSASQVDDIPVSAKELRRAFQKLQVLGKTNVEALICDLEFYGIVLLGHVSYSLDQVKDAITRLLGEDGAALIIDRLRKTLQIAN